MVLRKIPPMNRVLEVFLSMVGEFEESARWPPIDACSCRGGAQFLGVDLGGTRRARRSQRVRADSA